MLIDAEQAGWVGSALAFSPPLRRPLSGGVDYPCWPAPHFPVL